MHAPLLYVVGRKMSTIDKLCPTYAKKNHPYYVFYCNRSENLFQLIYFRFFLVNDYLCQFCQQIHILLLPRPNEQPES
jgi:hypothetical protein